MSIIVHNVMTGRLKFIEGAEDIEEQKTFFITEVM